MRHALVLSPVVQDARNPALPKVLTSPLRPQRARSPTVPSSLPSHRRLGSSRLLLFAHLRERQAGVAGNDLEDGVG